MNIKKSKIELTVPKMVAIKAISFISYLAGFLSSSGEALSVATAIIGKYDNKLTKSICIVRGTPFFRQPSHVPNYIADCIKQAAFLV